MRPSRHLGSAGVATGPGISSEECLGLNGTEDRAPFSLEVGTQVCLASAAGTMSSGAEVCICLHSGVPGRTWGPEFRKGHGRHVPILARGHTPFPKIHAYSKLQNATVFRNRIFAHAVKLTRVKVSPYPMTGALIRGGKPDRHRRRKPCEVRGRGWNDEDAKDRQGLPATTRSWEQYMEQILP